MIITPYSLRREWELYRKRLSRFPGEPIQPSQEAVAGRLIGPDHDFLGAYSYLGVWDDIEPDPARRAMHDELRQILDIARAGSVTAEYLMDLARRYRCPRVLEDQFYQDPEVMAGEALLNGGVFEGLLWLRENFERDHPKYLPTLRILHSLVQKVLTN